MEYEKLIKTEPTNTVITEFIKLETIGLPNKLDLPATKVNYQNESKSLDISITINSQAFIRDSIYANSSPELIAAVIRNVLYNYSVHIPQDISNVTLVPQSINFYTYWDDVLLLGTHFSRDKKRYRIKEPYPELTIWGTPSEWYFEYGNDHKKLNVSLKPLPTNKIKIDFKPYIKTAAGHL
ncbi:hypothetical protein [Paenibacillus glycanilyticus]|uniref:hypothetical protein n=1 Tax=Paenibacillus glycanilyticus TaxID=126569 RepID=UPI003EBBDCF2